MKPRNKIAIATGGAPGIGLAGVEALAGFGERETAAETDDRSTRDRGSRFGGETRAGDRGGARAFTAARISWYVHSIRGVSAAAAAAPPIRGVDPMA